MSAEDVHCLLLVVYAEYVSWPTIVKYFALFHNGGGDTNDIQGAVSLSKPAVFAYSVTAVKKPLQPELFQ
jgi:hypothetical protein